MPENWILLPSQIRFDWEHDNRWIWGYPICRQTHEILCDIGSHICKPPSDRSIRSQIRRLSILIIRRYQILIYAQLQVFQSGFPSALGSWVNQMYQLSGRSCSRFWAFGRSLARCTAATRRRGSASWVRKSWVGSNAWQFVCYKWDIYQPSTVCCFWFDI